MGNKGRLLIVFAALLICGLGYLWFMSGDRSGASTYISSNWDKEGELDFDPNGYGLFLDMLRQNNPEITLQKVDHADSLKKTAPKAHVIVVIAEKVGFLKEEWKRLQEQAQRGATVLIIGNQFSSGTANALEISEQLTYYYSQGVHVGFSENENREQQAYKIYQNDTLAAKWFVMESLSSGNPLMYINENKYCSVKRLSEGEGYIITGLNTDFFKNYQINRTRWRQFMQAFVDQLPKYKRISWLNFGSLTEEENGGTDEGSKGNMEDDSLLKIIFSNRVLTMALLLAVIGFVLFILFRTRRNRPVIPLPIEKPASTADFSQTVAAIFLHRRNPYGVLLLQKKNFYNLIQRYYYLDLSRKNDDHQRLLELLSEKSGETKENLQKIIQMLETKVKINVTDQYLFEVYHRISSFYEKAGIHKLSERKSRTLLGSANRSMGFGTLLLLVALNLFTGGLYLLSAANPYGVLLFILSGLVFVWSYAMTNIPVLAWDDKKLTVMTKSCRKTSFNWADLDLASCDAKEVHFRFKGRGSIGMTWSEISSFDKGRLQRLIELKSKNK